MLRLIFSLSFFWMLIFSSLAQGAEYTELKQLKGPVQFEPGGQYWVQTAENDLHLWSRQSKKIQHSIHLPAPISQVVFTPDGQWLAASDRVGNVGVWRRAGWKRTYWRQAKSEFQSLALSPDGMYLTLAHLEPLNTERSRLQLKLYDYDLRQHSLLSSLSVMEVRNTLPGHTPNISLLYHPLSQYLAVGVEADQGHWLLVKDDFAGRWSYWMPGSPPLAYSQNGRYFSYIAPDAQKRWFAKLWHTSTDLQKTIPQPVAPPPVSDVTLSPAARFVALTTPVKGRFREVVIYRVQDLKLLVRVQVPEQVDTLSFSADEKELLMSSFVAPEFHPLLYRLP